MIDFPSLMEELAPIFEITFFFLLGIVALGGLCWFVNKIYGS